jgi:predicted Zn-dependent peptidase
MDRTIAPEIKPIKTLNIVAPQSHSLNSGGHLFHLSEVDDEAVKIDLIFDAGTSKYNNIISKLTGDLLLSGTQNKSSSAIEEAIDRLGGFTNVEVSADESVVSVLGLREHIVSLLEIVVDAILHIKFDEREINQSIAQRKQRFEINMGKVSTLARRKFISLVFPDSPYGVQTEKEDFDQLDRHDIIEFHRKHYIGALQKVAVVGNLSAGNMQKIENLVSAFQFQPPIAHFVEYQYTPTAVDVEKKGALQTAIRIGRVLFNKQHEDFIDFSVLNTILGGYFGSRLMTSIREEKGYTYGIGSGVAQLKDTGYFFISTEVGEQYKEDTIAAIRLEIEKLQQELVNAEELELVRNYITGQLLSNADGPFAQMDRYLSVIKHGKDLSYYNEVLSRLNLITPERIRSLAQEYLNWDDLIVVKAG